VLAHDGFSKRTLVVRRVFLVCTRVTCLVSMTAPLSVLIACVSCLVFMIPQSVDKMSVCRLIGW